MTTETSVVLKGTVTDPSADTVKLQVEVRPIGSAFTMTNAWQFFLGYRFAIFNYATESLGGSVTVSWFSLDVP